MSTTPDHELQVVALAMSLGHLSRLFVQDRQACIDRLCGMPPQQLRELLLAALALSDSFSEDCKPT